MNEVENGLSPANQIFPKPNKSPTFTLTPKSLLLLLTFPLSLSETFSLSLSLSLEQRFGVQKMKKMATTFWEIWWGCKDKNALAARNNEVQLEVNLGISIM